MPQRPFGMRDKVAYMFGDVGNAFTFMLQSTFFMIFYTNVVGIRPEHVGALLFGARLLDAFTDVIMGVIVDRTPVGTAGTKFRRWIKWVAIPVAIASSLMYMAFVADFNSYEAKLVWMIATYVLWGAISYTAINIPYGSMPSAVSTDPDHRAELSVWRSTGANVANLAINGTLPVIVYVTNEAGVSVLSGERMMWSSIICSILAVVCYMMLYFNITERVVDNNEPKEQVSIAKMLGTVVTNRALLGLIASAILLLLSMTFLMGMISYLFLDWFGNGKLVSPASIAAVLPATLTLVVLAPKMAKRFGKAESAIISMIVAGITLLLAYFLQINNAVVWIIFYAITMYAINVFNYLVWAMITDVIDYQEVRTGSRDDGTVYSVYSFSRKLGQAFAGGLIGVALGMVGYDATAASEGVAQAQNAIDGVYFLANVLPGVGCLLVAAALIFFYPLKKKQVEENNAILQQRA